MLATFNQLLKRVKVYPPQQVRKSLTDANGDFTDNFIDVVYLVAEIEINGKVYGRYREIPQTIADTNQGIVNTALKELAGTVARQALEDAG